MSLQLDGISLAGEAVQAKGMSHKLARPSIGSATPCTVAWPVMWNVQARLAQFAAAQRRLGTTRANLSALLHISLPKYE